MNNALKINVGVIGVGHLGPFHIEQYQSINNVNLVGFYDIDSLRSKDIERKYKIKAFDSLENMLSDCDAVSVVTPTPTHFEIAKKAINMDCHVLIEKPIKRILMKLKIWWHWLKIQIKLSRWDI